MNVLDAALEYAERGWQVLPLHHPLPLGGCSCARPDCRSISKHPRIVNGIYGASTDPAQITAWWHRWPRANVGIATGAVSGFDVLDVDPRNGGDASLAELVQQHGGLPETVEQITGGGGRHLFFVHADVTWPKSLGPGLDVKADAGCIVTPPSRHASGNLYAWELSSDPTDTPIAAWPDWLLALASPATRHAAASPRVQSGHPIPVGRWERVLAGCKRLREMATVQRDRGLGYHDWLAAISVARLGGDEGTAWAVELTESYAPGVSANDLDKLASWLSGGLHGATTCVSLGCHPGRCGFRPRGEHVQPSPLRHAWTRRIDVEVA